METFVDAWRWLVDPANWRGPQGIGTRLVEHLWLSGVSVLIACVIAIPVALWLGHIGKGGNFAINVSNIGRAVPTLAVLVLLVLSPLGISTWSMIIALVLFALPPLLTNTYVGMREVDRDAVEAARGMGMSGPQLLRKVEFPLAVPLMMNGVRLAAVQVVATATIAALVAGPGLGRIITAGYGLQNLPQVIAGAIVVAALALVVEGLMEWLRRALDPVRRARQRGRKAIVRPDAEELSVSGS